MLLIMSKPPLARNRPTGTPNCGQLAIRPRLPRWPHSIESSTEPPHSPPTPTPWMKRITVRMTAPPDPDRLIGGDEANRRSGKPGQEQRGDQRRLAADAVAKVAEDRGADRPGDETHCVNGERLQHADQRIGLGKKQLAKDEAGHRAVEQEVVPFDGGAYGAGD